jgi:hypothetical protein
MEAMPLSVLDIGWPQLGLGGIASGTLSYRFGAKSASPSGDANLRVRGLTRSGLVLSSKPVDIGIVARLAGGNAAFARRGQRGADDRPGAGAARTDRPLRQYRRAAQRRAALRAATL